MRKYVNGDKKYLVFHWFGDFEFYCSQFQTPVGMEIQTSKILILFPVGMRNEISVSDGGEIGYFSHRGRFFGIFFWQSDSRI